MEDGDEVGMGRQDEFAAYVDARWTRLVRSAVLMGCPAQDAEDVVQAALTQCYVHWRRVRRADNPDAYVHRVVVNTFLTSRRRRWWGETPTETLPEVAETDATVQVDVADAVGRTLARLTAEQRTVVVMRHYAHMSEAQMAEALQVPVGTVKSRLSRALKVLAADLELIELEGIA